MMDWDGCLELDCDGSDERNISGDWCLAETSLYGGRTVTFIRALLGGWRVRYSIRPRPHKHANLRRSGFYLLCPECSRSVEIMKIEGALRSNGMRTNQD